MDSWPDAEIAIRETLSTYMLEHTIVNGFTINPLTTTIENDINRIRQVAQGTTIHLEDVELYKRVLKQHNLVAIKLILLHLSPVLRDTMEHVQFASEIWRFLTSTYGAASIAHPLKVKQDFDDASIFPINEKTALAEKTYTDWILNLIRARSICVRAQQDQHVTPAVMISKIIVALQYFMPEVAREFASSYLTTPNQVISEADLQSVIATVNRHDGYSTSYRAHLLKKKPTINTLMPGTTQTVPQPDRKKQKSQPQKRKSDAGVEDQKRHKSRGKHGAGTPTTPGTSGSCDICKRIGRTTACFTCGNCKGHGHARALCPSPVNGNESKTPAVNTVGSQLSGDQIYLIICSSNDIDLCHTLSMITSTFVIIYVSNLFVLMTCLSYDLNLERPFLNLN